MKNLIRILYFVITGVAFISNVSCDKDNIDIENKILKEQIAGLVQKGPYINGTQIVLMELNSSLEQTGKVFTTQISNDWGLFEINNVELSSSFVELSASGYYFDEVSGNISNSPLSLYALSDVTELTSINVNILTHLERQRVHTLVVNNEITFKAAKDTAQKEILAMFGFQNNDKLNSEALNISSGEEANAILLAISIILQGDRSVGELTELLANISTDLKDDGILNNESILEDLRYSTINLDLEYIRQNLVDRFESLNADFVIPPFEKYIGYFLSFTAQKPEVIAASFKNLQSDAVTLLANVNHNNSATTIHFEYGITNDYEFNIEGVQNVVYDSITYNAYANLKDLEPGTLYHYRVRAENAIGINYGDDQTFTTLGQVPEIDSVGVKNITNNTAILFTSVNPHSLSTSVIFEYGLTTDYGESITSNNSPLLGSNKLPDDISVSGLEPGKTYHYRVRAENQLGISYSDDFIFTTAAHGISGTVTDIDDNIYNTIGIGFQIWMVENLKTTSLNDGTTISEIIDLTNWDLNPTPAYSWYNNDETTYKDIYGAIYNWHTVSSEKLCPSGWHVPSSSDWNQLIDFIVADGHEKMQEFAIALKATNGWDNNGNGTDVYGFSALPAGYIGAGSYHCQYEAAGIRGDWWSSTEFENNNEQVDDVYYLFIIDNNEFGWLWNYTTDQKRYGKSVRCIKD